MNNLVQLQGVFKAFLGRGALQNIQLDIPSGKIIGLLGPNGSGKSTLLRVISGLCPPSSGSLFVLGQRPGRETRAQVAYLPDRVDAPGWMQVGDLLDYYRKNFADFDEQRVPAYMDLFELHPQMRLKYLSKGMQERAWLLATLCRRAKLYLLDEPLGGIDPVARQKVMDALLALPREDETILLSTHMVGELERLFDQAIFIGQGRILRQEDCEDLREREGKSLQQTYQEVFGNA